jgi:hypothetical protein
MLTWRWTKQPSRPAGHARRRHPWRDGPQSTTLAQRVKQLVERYEIFMPQMATRVTELEAKVNQHLEKMGFSG